jgi:hypothetical protein
VNEVKPNDQVGECWVDPSVLTYKRERQITLKVKIKEGPMESTPKTFFVCGLSPKGPDRRHLNQLTVLPHVACRYI